MPDKPEPERPSKPNDSHAENGAVAGNKMADTVKSRWGRVWDFISRTEVILSLIAAATAIALGLRQLTGGYLRPPPFKPAAEVTQAVDGGVESIANVITTLPFRPAAEDEVLVIVTDFTGEGAGATAARIYYTLAERVDAGDLTRVRIERLQDVAPEGAKDAIAIGEQFNATLVIWGIADGYGIEPRYEVVRHQGIIKKRPELGVIPATDPTFVVYVLEGAPREFEYLVLFSLGQMAYFSDDYQEAIARFDQALAIDLGERSADLNLAAVYLYRGFCHGALGNPQAALDDFDRAIELDPRYVAIVYFGKGNIHSELYDYEAAIAEYTYAIELIPWYADAYFNRGWIYYTQGNLQAALADYSRAIEIDPVGPQRVGAYVGRGIIYAKLGDLEAALTDFERAIELDPQYALAYANRGLAHAALGDLEAALADYTRAIELDPQYTWAYNWRGDTYYNLGNFEAALADFTRAIELDPQYTWAYNNRANTYRVLGDYEAAFADFGRAIELDPQFEPAYTNRGLAYYQQDNYQAALADCTRAIELDPRDAVAYYNRGLAYDSMGNAQAAIADYEQFLALYTAEDEPSAYARERIEGLRGQ
jgi:tetratricopeptide (TPR) repeat protein